MKKKEIILPTLPYGEGNFSWMDTFTPLYNFFVKNNAQGSFWCIISLQTKYTKESDPVRLIYYTTKIT